MEVQRSFYTEFLYYMLTPQTLEQMATVAERSVRIPFGARFLRTRELRNMSAKAMVGSCEVHRVLKRGLSCIQDDLAVVNDPNALKRDKKESLTRMSQCVGMLNMAVDKQHNNLATIQGADSANYVAKRLATVDKRKFREEANGLEPSAFEEVEAWCARSMEHDQAEISTSPKFQHNKRAKDDSDINKQPVVHADADAMEVDLDTVMNLEAGGSSVRNVWYEFCAEFRKAKDTLWRKSGKKTRSYQLLLAT